MSMVLSPSGSSRLTPNHPSTAPPAARRPCWVDSRRQVLGAAGADGHLLDVIEVGGIHQLRAGRAGRSRALCSSSGPARTEPIPVKGRAPGSSERLHRSGERTHGRSAPLNASPPNSLSRGVWGSSSAPRSRALGGKSGMTRAEPLVFRYGGSKGNHSPWPHNVRNCSQLENPFIGTG